MNVIAKKALRDFCERCPDAELALQAWYHEVCSASWENSAELKSRYGSASIINAERVVFNICGNKYRLVVRINYASSTVFVRFLGTHKEYDNIDVEAV